MMVVAVLGLGRFLIITEGENEVTSVESGLLLALTKDGLVELLCPLCTKTELGVEAGVEGGGVIPERGEAVRVDLLAILVAFKLLLCPEALVTIVIIFKEVEDEEGERGRDLPITGVVDLVTLVVLLL